MNHLRSVLVIVFAMAAGFQSGAAEAPAPPPVRIAIVGLVHGHTRNFIATMLGRSDLKIVGIAEPDPDLRKLYLERFKFPPEISFPDCETMLDRVRPQAVAIFTSTFDHTKTVEACAARGVHAMMEKPMAVDLEHARAMAAAAKKGNIEVVVNFSTTWFPSNQQAYQLVHDDRAIGELRKIVVHDGHSGGKRAPEFHAWLNDPVLNGGGVTMDFGCYGANLITWFMREARPTSVFAVTQQFQPEIWTNVEDEATIVVTYPRTQGIIQASWNWPFARKDTELYGKTGYLLAPQPDQLRVRRAGEIESPVELPTHPDPSNQVLAYLVSIARGEARSTGPSSLAVNLIATEILDAAKESARTGKRIDLPLHSP